MPASPRVKVNVRNVAVGGAGVGEVCEQDDGGRDLLGITAFVPFAATGELVEAQVTEKKKRHVVAELVSIERESEARVEPFCEYFTVCGGCELQHISYAGQLNAKQEMIRGQLRAARVGLDVVERVRAVEPSEPYGYRRRLNVHIDSSGKVGLYRSQSRSVVPISNCAVAEASISQTLASLQDFGRSVQGKLTSILLESDAQGVVAVLKAPFELTSAEIKTVLDNAKPHFKNVTLMVGGSEVAGYGRQILELPLSGGSGFSIQVPAGSFSQVNWGINQKLIQSVMSYVEHGPGELATGKKVEDLYAGAGNFAIPAARAGADVIAVECDKRLVNFGRQNAERLHLSRRVRYVDSTVEKYLSNLEKGHQTDILIADPPRSGLGTIVSDVAYAERIILISCHLPSFARDVKALTENGYRASEIESYDMFAQTSYVELVAVLDRE